MLGSWLSVILAESFYSYCICGVVERSLLSSLRTKNSSIIEIESNLVIALQLENGAESKSLRSLCDLFCSLNNSICCFSLKLGQSVDPSYALTSLPDWDPLADEQGKCTAATSGTKTGFTAMPVSFYQETTAFLVMRWRKGWFNVFKAWDKMKLTQ